MSTQEMGYSRVAAFSDLRNRTVTRRPSGPGRLRRIQRQQVLHEGGGCGAVAF